jgi:hypothetical protein
MMKRKEDASIRISLVDRSLYYKSLLLLIRKDREIRDEEKSMMMNIGRILGFDSKFCANTLAEILDNNHIIDSPPLFSETHIALCFIRDGLRLSAADGEIHKAERSWLKSVAENNGLGNLWAEEIEKFHRDRHAENPENSLALRHFQWE